MFIQAVPKWTKSRRLRFDDSDDNDELDDNLISRSEEERWKRRRQRTGRGNFNGILCKNCARATMIVIGESY